MYHSPVTRPIWKFTCLLNNYFAIGDLPFYIREAPDFTLFLLRASYPWKHHPLPICAYPMKLDIHCTQIHSKIHLQQVLMICCTVFTLLRHNFFLLVVLQYTSFLQQNAPTFSSRAPIVFKPSHNAGAHQQSLSTTCLHTQPATSDFYVYTVLPQQFPLTFLPSQYTTAKAYACNCYTLQFTFEA